MRSIIVNVENEVGVIAAVSKILADQEINIVNMNTADIDDTGVISISTEDDDHDKALWWLADAGYKAMTEEALVVTMPDEPGALAKVAEKLAGESVNIVSIHIVNRAHGHTTVSLSTDDQDKARALMKDALVT